MTRILVATDLSPRCNLAVRRVALLGRQLDAGLVLLHVMDEARTEEESAAARNEIEATAASLQEEGVRAEPLIRSGDVVDECVAYAQDYRPNLIVTGAPDARRFRVFVGSTVERIMRTAQRPVLMVNTEPTGPYRRVLLAADMSKASANAIETARALRILEDASITVLHVHQPPGKAMMIAANVAPESIEAHSAHSAQDAAKQLALFMSESALRDVPHDRLVEEGSAYWGISRTVTRLQPDLVVIGTHGYSSLARVLVGSVAEEVLRKIDCDILAVPPTFSPPR